MTLSRWVGALKRWSVRQAKAEVGETLTWQPNFYEHVLRREEDVSVTARYIIDNPVRKGLVSTWREYPWCGSFAWSLEE